MMIIIIVIIIMMIEIILIIAVVIINSTFQPGDFPTGPTTEDRAMIILLTLSFMCSVIT